MAKTARSRNDSPVLVVLRELPPGLYMTYSESAGSLMVWARSRPGHGDEIKLLGVLDSQIGVGGDGPAEALDVVRLVGERM